MSADQPAVLPWHREAAKSLYEAKHNNYIGAGMIAHIIAGYDPHAETLRLLEDILAVLEERTTGHTVVYSDRLRPFIGQIRAHLAAHSKPDETKGTQ